MKIRYRSSAITWIFKSAVNVLLIVEWNEYISISPK